MHEVKNLNNVSSGRILIDFYASWCGPCRKLTPILEDLQERYPSVTFYKVNIDECEPELVELYEIRSLPTIIVLEDGNILSRIVGFNPNKIEEALK